VTSRPDENSKRTRVEPVFAWLHEHGGNEWPARLIALAHGLEVRIEPGPLVGLRFEVEHTVAASPERLAWMLENVPTLIPRDGRRWAELQARVLRHPLRDEVVQRLRRGEAAGIPRELVLEGRTHADCLIECERAVVWVEGKRNDWLETSTTWDSARDQVARNLEAARSLARDLGKHYCVVVCYEDRLKAHEEQLIAGYRAGTWRGGLPHLDQGAREELGRRIGILRWREIVAEWPGLRERPELASLAG
jgi:hypothetical protein